MLGNGGLFLLERPRMDTGRTLLEITPVESSLIVNAKVEDQSVIERINRRVYASIESGHVLFTPRNNLLSL